MYGVMMPNPCGPLNPYGHNNCDYQHQRHDHAQGEGQRNDRVGLAQQRSAVRCVLVLCPSPVKDPGRESAGARAAQSARTSSLHQARAGGHRAQRDVVLGHHSAAGTDTLERLLPLLLDIFSRYAVGWMVAERENATLAATLIEQTCLKQGIEPQVLTQHSDRDSGFSPRAR